MCLISVIIPVKNGEATLEKCLSGIYSQSVADRLEVIILDSGSKDDSLTICSKFPTRIIPIEPSTFNHGLTRNYGVTIATGEYLYFTVQDAWIAENDMLERMVEHFRDEMVQGVVGMQATPSDPDKNPATWFKRISMPQVEERLFENSTFSNLSTMEQFQLSNWDNVNAMYRRSALIKIPFKNTNFSEDWLWANNALHAGMKLIRDPSCVTFHYHHKDFSYAFRVEYIMNYSFFKNFNVLPAVPNIVTLLTKNIYRIMTNKDITVFKKFFWIKHNVAALTGFALSNLAFRIAHMVRKDSGVDFTYKFFCKHVPQGKSK